MFSSYCSCGGLTLALALALTLALALVPWFIVFHGDGSSGKHKVNNTIWFLATESGTVGSFGGGNFPKEGHYQHGGGSGSRSFSLLFLLGVFDASIDTSFSSYDEEEFPVRVADEQQQQQQQQQQQWSWW